MKRTGTLALLATITGSLAIVVFETSAYSTYGKWGTLTVNVYVNPANADVSKNAAISALQTGMNAWNTQTGTAFRFAYAGQVGSTTTGFDRKNIILFRNQSHDKVIASTYAWSSGGNIVDTDIVFWDGGWKFFTGSGGCDSGAYIEDISAHELGHALGLKHSSVTEATMYGRYARCSQTKRTLASDDIAGAKSLYGVGAVTDTPPVVTILAPANGARVSPTTSVTFKGSAIDVPDGDISSKLVWRSSISGQIGTGASFSRTLVAGTHTISATVKDSIGFTIQQSIIVYVTP